MIRIWVKIQRTLVVNDDGHKVVTARWATVAVPKEWGDDKIEDMVGGHTPCGWQIIFSSRKPPVGIAVV